MNKIIHFSIIIPFKIWSADLDECLSHIGKMNSKFYEIVLLPDDEITLATCYSYMPIKIIPTGAVSPAIKRDIGGEKASGQYLAFIDDDAYPQSDWLEVALRFLSNQTNVGAIGGAAITPKSDPFWARVSGAVFLSKLSGGFPERYASISPSKEVDDWPSVNLIVRKDVFLEVGGYDSNFWPGEDTKLCRDIILKGWKIIYVPELIVHHHRRAKLVKHLRQIGNYGYHRGFFAKHYPENSRKLTYFVPTIFVIFLIVGTLGSFFSATVRLVFVAGLLAYGLALVKALWDIKRHEEWKVTLCSPIYIFLTHVWYGVRFFKGLFAKKYQGSLGR
jgi:glycosyltransferase involved in cell wall biosynthesis